MMEHLGFEVRRLSHMKRAVRPQVKMKLKQHWQQPPDLAMFGCSRVSGRIYMMKKLSAETEIERDRNVVENCYEVEI